MRAAAWRSGPWLASGLGLLALLLWEFGGWDLAVTRLYADSAGFAWRDTWLARGLLHDGGRWLAGALLLLLFSDIARPIGAGPGREERLYWLAVVIASMLLVPMLKRISATSCPWDLLEFGGTVRYVQHWLPRVTDGGPGHCFPSGHAVSAFAFFGAFFLWRPYRPRLARFFLVVTLLLGLAYGWAQLARGAHFVSHSLWSAWLCWTLAAAAGAFRGWPRAIRPAASAALEPPAHAPAAAR